MIIGAGAICTAKASESERFSWNSAMQRECVRYGLDAKRVAASLDGKDPLSADKPERKWWEGIIVAIAVGVFVWLAMGTKRQALAVSLPWMIVLLMATFVCLIVCGWFLWRRTRFS